MGLMQALPCHPLQAWFNPEAVIAQWLLVRAALAPAMWGLAAAIPQIRFPVVVRAATKVAALKIRIVRGLPARCPATVSAPGLGLF
mmetsp:Transcript_37665/g.99633  ORF Transcript_37665/g.99633 Transcript_37665/m.99633 type:complete len:86 (-) Transcript_37665:1735-1992(-)